jgi:heme-degrading monooxygenase HmoA
MTRWTVAGVVLLAAACGDDASQTDGEGGNATGQGGEAGGAPADAYAHLYECQEVAFEEGKPLSGPGYDPMTGFVGTPQAKYIVHTTQIYVRPEQENAFFQAAGKVIAQLSQTDGLVAYALAGDDGCGVQRTMGVWESEEALYAFVGSGAHVEAMQKTGELSFTGRTTNWEATSDEVLALTWDVARGKLAEVAAVDGYY